MNFITSSSSSYSYKAMPFDEGLKCPEARDALGASGGPEGFEWMVALGFLRKSQMRNRPVRANIPAPSDKAWDNDGFVRRRNAVPISAAGKS